MDAKSCPKFVVVILVVMVASQASVAGASALGCHLKCWTLCAPNPRLLECLNSCLSKCPDQVGTTEDQCNLGCVISKCLDPHPDVKKAEGCANLCAEGCKQSYRKF